MSHKNLLDVAWIMNRKRSIAKPLSRLLTALLLALIGALLSVALAARAAPQAGVVGDGTPASCTDAALSAALVNGGSITFSCGSNPVTITLTSRKTINVDAIIDGGGLITLSGGGARGIVRVPIGRSLTLKALTLRDAASDNGAVENGGALTLTHVRVIDNARGGVISTVGAVADIANSSFERNQLYGALYNQAATMTVAGSLFVSNTAFNGGAIANTGTGILTVTQSTFASNTGGSSGSGGAIYSGGGARAFIAHSRFISNAVDGAGGAIYGDNAPTVSDSVFIGNVANAGGGLYSRGAVVVQNSRFSGNRADIFFGGAITHYDLSSPQVSLLVVDTTLDANTAVNKFGSNASGGALFFNGGDNGYLTMINVTVSGNTADSGGGLFLSSGEAALTHVTLADNVAADTSGDHIETIVNPAPVTTTLRNSLIAAGACWGAIIDGGGNLQDAGTSCGASLNGDPLLGALADNGGPTPTRALAANSPARHAALNAHCADFDQRGLARLQNGTCDVGAFEFGATPGLTAIDPTGVRVNGPAFTLTAYGANFIQGSRVLWNGSALTTTFVTSAELAAFVPASLLTTIGDATVTIETPAPDGGLAAGSRILKIRHQLYLPLVRQ